jgi:PBP1b-binding outer membrane lipoprotein LpoB
LISTFSPLPALSQALFSSKSNKFASENQTKEALDKSLLINPNKLSARSLSISLKLALNTPASELP